MVASLTIVISYLGALLVVLIPPSRTKEIRWVALITTLLGLATAISCATRRNTEAPDGGFQDVLHFEWIPTIGASFHLG